MLKAFSASRALMEEFEDVKKLSTTKNGSLLIQMIKVSLTIIILNFIKNSTNIGSAFKSVRVNDKQRGCRL